jgi:hypothetical protein
MKTQLLLLLTGLITILSCNTNEAGKYPVTQADWDKKKSTISDFGDFTQGKTYLPVYSHIYHIEEDRTFDLTITVSIRNISPDDTLFILKADYFNTVGDNIRQYIDQAIYLNPLETKEIVIDEQDIEGGSGANFVFSWAMRSNKNPPLFEAVMISSYGQQGLSFVTRGVPIDK